MKRVAISTLRKKVMLSNYGTFFQHYALREILKSFGLHPFRVLKAGRKNEFFSLVGEISLDGLRVCYWFLRRALGWRVAVKRVVLKHRMRFGFYRDYLTVIGSFFEDQTIEEDTIGVMGSDQVFWAEDDRAWLAHIPKGNSRITYAASVDWKTFESDLKRRRDLAMRLKDFTAIGIREKHGRDICMELVQFNREVAHVADPVLLLGVDAFRKCASKRRVFNNRTLFCYLVNINSFDELRCTEYEKMARLLDCELKMLGTQGADLYIPKKFQVFLTPLEFLRAVEDAAYFATNSFHGTAFAVLYKKKFISVSQTCPIGTNRNERQQELLNLLGLNNRIADYRMSGEQWKMILDQPMGWEFADESLDAFRTFSYEWLKDAIKTT